MEPICTGWNLSAQTGTYLHRPEPRSTHSTMRRKLACPCPFAILSISSLRPFVYEGHQGAPRRASPLRPEGQASRSNRSPSGPVFCWGGRSLPSSRGRPGCGQIPSGDGLRNNARPRRVTMRDNKQAGKKGCSESKWSVWSPSGQLGGRNSQLGGRNSQRGGLFSQLRV